MMDEVIRPSNILASKVQVVEQKFLPQSSMSILFFPYSSEETCFVLQMVTSVRKDLRRLERLPFSMILPSRS